MTDFVRRIIAIIILLTIAAGGSTTASADAILVLGGTGQLGARVVKLLQVYQHDVTVLVRPTSDRSRLDGIDVNYVVGDLLDADEVASAIAKARPDVIINTVRAPIGEIPFYDISSKNIIAAAKILGVKQIVHHGAVGAGENMRQFPDVPWSQVPGLEARMIDHGIAEQNFLDSGIATTIIRNSRVWPDSTPATGNAILGEDHSVITPITRADLAILTLQCLNKAKCVGKIYHAEDQSLVGLPRPNEPAASPPR